MRVCANTADACPALNEQVLALDGEFTELQTRELVAAGSWDAAHPSPAAAEDDAEPLLAGAQPTAAQLQQKVMNRILRAISEHESDRRHSADGDSGAAGSSSGAARRQREMSPELQQQLEAGLERINQSFIQVRQRFTAVLQLCTFRLVSKNQGSCACCLLPAPFEDCTPWRP